MEKDLKRAGYGSHCTAFNAAVRNRVRLEKLDNDDNDIRRRRGIPLRQRGRVYGSCVQIAMVYASEIWGRGGAEDGEK